MIPEKTLLNWFEYYRPVGTQPTRYILLRKAALDLAKQINAAVPDCDEKTVAISSIRMAVMMATAGIACNEDPEELAVDPGMREGLRSGVWGKNVGDDLAANQKAKAADGERGRGEFAEQARRKLASDLEAVLKKEALAKQAAEQQVADPTTLLAVATVLQEEIRAVKDDISYARGVICKAPQIALERGLGMVLDRLTEALAWANMELGMPNREAIRSRLLARAGSIPEGIYNRAMARIEGR